MYCRDGAFPVSFYYCGKYIRLEVDISVTESAERNEV